MSGMFYAAKGSTEWIEHRHCKRKRRFESEPMEYPAGWNAYRCKFCDGWHLTSKRAPSRKEREKREARRLERRAKMIEVIKANSSQNMTQEACDRQAERIADALSHIHDVRRSDENTIQKP